MSEPPCIRCIVQASCQAKIKNKFMAITELLRSCPYLKGYVIKKGDRRINKLRISKVSMMFGYKMKYKKRTIHLTRLSDKRDYFWFNNEII